MDAIPTVDLLPPLLGIIAIGADAFVYSLEAGTDAEDLPTIIRPLDYDGGTNAKVWKRKSFVIDDLPTPSPFRLKEDGGVWYPQLKNETTDEWHTIGLKNVEGVPTIYPNETGEA